jgi:hypothetical protein
LTMVLAVMIIVRYQHKQHQNDTSLGNYIHLKLEFKGGEWRNCDRAESTSWNEWVVELQKSIKDAEASVTTGAAKEI